VLRLITTWFFTIVVSAAAPMLVTIEGNFGPSDGVVTVLDNEAYLVLFTITDPAHPHEQVAIPALDYFSVTYETTGSLSVPGVGFFTEQPIVVNFSSLAGSNDLEFFPFRSIPAGDFLLVNPLRTLSGTPLWNGQAGALGTPVIFPLDREPAFVFWRLTEFLPGLPIPAPLASYQEGTSLITIANVPEPSTSLLVGIALCAVGSRSIFRTYRKQLGSGPLR
jgi:hypothetical protein